MHRRATRQIARGASQRNGKLNPVNWRDDIIHTVKGLRPDRVLAVMPASEPLWRKLVRGTGDVAYTRISGTELLAHDFNPDRSQVAIVAATLEHMDKREASTVIARLRDLYSNVVYAAVPIGDQWPELVSHWDNGELIAHGLHPVRQYGVGDKLLSIYYYDIYDYKLTPDWLNSKHWANPHRWDVERW